MSTEGMKWAAIGAMLIEHWYRIVLDSHFSWATSVGRIAFPLFALLVGLNLFRTSSVRGFAWRLLCWGVVAQLVWWFAWGFERGLNVLFTLAAGLLVAQFVWRRGGLWVVSAAGLVVWSLEIASGARLVEYGAMGVLAVVWGSVVFQRGWGTMGWIGFGVCVVLANVGALWIVHLVYGLLALLAIPVWWVGLGWKVWRLPTVAYYALYPAHVGAFALVRLFM